MARSTLANASSRRPSSLSAPPSKLWAAACFGATLMALRKNLTASAERLSSAYATPRRQSASTFFGSNFKIWEYRAAASVTAPRRCMSSPSCSKRDASALVTLHLVRSTCATAAPPRKRSRPRHSTRRCLQSPAMQVGFDQELRAAAETNAVDLKVFEYALDVIARFGERDALDPVDRIDLRVARIAIFCDPFLHAPAPGIVAGEGEDMRAAIVDVEIAELGRPQLHVVRLVAQQPLLVEGRAEFLGHIASRFGRDLHQAHGARAGNGLRVEGALLASDGEDHGALDRRANGAILGNADGRKGIVIERKPAPERGLAEQQHGARILVAGGDFADRGKGDGVDRPFAEIGQRACDQVPFVDGVEKLDRAHDFEPCDRIAPIRRGLGQGTHDDVLVPESCARELTVVGGGIARRRLVMRARFVPSPQRFRRAPLPIARARERDRVAVALSDLGEVSERGSRIVKEAQRDPAGGELMLGAVVVFVRDRGVAGDAIGGLDFTEIEQLAGNESALDPPLVGIERLSVLGR